MQPEKSFNVFLGMSRHPTHGVNFHFFQNLKPAIRVDFETTCRIVPVTKAEEVPKELRTIHIFCAESILSHFL